MNATSNKAKKLAAALRRRNKVLPWREMAIQDYRGQIHYAVLCKIAKTDGAYIPNDLQSQKLLGLIKERSPYSIMPRWWERTPQALEKFNHTRANVKEMFEKTKSLQKAYKVKK